MNNIGSFPFAAACNNCSHVGGHYQNEKNNRDSGMYKHIKCKTKQKKKNAPKLLLLKMMRFVLKNMKKNGCKAVEILIKNILYK